GAMATVFGSAFAFSMLALVVAITRFWWDSGERVQELVRLDAWGNAASDAASLEYLGGGGEGCTYPDRRASFARRNCHHLTFYGFMLCFAATTVAAIYHYILGWRAPYPLLSLPVILGTLGGIGLIAGPVGLAWLKSRRDPELADTSQDGMDAGFLLLLALT